MEQAPDELSGHEGHASDEELDKLTGEPMNSPEKARDAEGGGPTDPDRDERSENH